MECGISIKNAQSKLQITQQIFNFLYSLSSKLLKIILELNQSSNSSKLQSALKKILPPSNSSRISNFVVNMFQILTQSLIQINDSCELSNISNCFENDSKRAVKNLIGLSQYLDKANNSLNGALITYEKVLNAQNEYDELFNQITKAKRKKDSVSSDLKDKYFISKLEINDVSIQKANENLIKFEPILNSYTLKMNQEIKESNYKIKELKENIIPSLLNTIKILQFCLIAFIDQIILRFTKILILPEFSINDEPEITNLLMSISKEYISNSLLILEKSDYSIHNDNEFENKILSIQALYQQYIQDHNSIISQIDPFFELIYMSLENIYKSYEENIQLDYLILKSEVTFGIINIIANQGQCCRNLFIEGVKRTLEFYKSKLFYSISIKLNEYCQKVTVDDEIFFKKIELILSKIKEIVVYKKKIGSLNQKIKSIEEKLSDTEKLILSQNQFKDYNEQITKYRENEFNENKVLFDLKNSFANYLTCYFLQWVHCWKENKIFLRNNLLIEIKNLMKPFYEEIQSIFAELKSSLNNCSISIKEAAPEKVLQDILEFYANKWNFKKEDILEFFNFNINEKNENLDLYINSLCLNVKLPPLNDNLLSYDFMLDLKKDKEKSLLIEFRPSLKSLNFELSPRLSKPENENKTTQLKWYEKSFGIDASKEPVKKKFNCSYSGNILLHGKMLVTTKSILFYSYFNDKTLFGKHTKIMIPFDDIERIEKVANSVNINNSILIRTVFASFVFTSFYKRDKKFSFISTQFESFRELRNAPTINLNELNDKNKDILEREEEIMKEIKKDCQIFLDDPVYQKIYKKFNCPIWIITKNMIPFSSDCNKEIHEKNKYFEISENELVNFPDYFISKENIAIRKLQTELIEESKNWNKIYTSKESYKKPIKPPPIPFFPNVVNIREERSIFVFGPHKIIIHNESFTSGIPYSDSFKTVQQIELTQFPFIGKENSQIETTLKTSFKVEFTKSMANFIKNILLKQADKEYAKHYRKIIMPILSKYLNNDIAKYSSEFNIAQIPKVDNNSENNQKNSCNKIEEQKNGKVKKRKKKCFWIQKTIVAAIIIFFFSFIIKILYSRN